MKKTKWISCMRSEEVAVVYVTHNATVSDITAGGLLETSASSRSTKRLYTTFVTSAVVLKTCIHTLMQKTGGITL